MGREEGSGVVALISGFTAAREDLTRVLIVSFWGVLAARPVGIMRLAQAGRGER